MTDRPRAKPRIIMPCEDCGEEYEGYAYMGVLSRYCQCCSEKRRRLMEMQEQERRQQSLAHHRNEWLTDPHRGIPPRFQGLSWEDFRFDRGGENNRPRVQKLREWAASFPVDRRPDGVSSLLIVSQLNGVGKTMLSGLALQDLIGRFDQIGRERCPFQFWPVGRVRQRLRAAERFSSTESVEEVYRDLANMWLLVLDDVGKEKLEGADVSFSYEMYYNIINERYNNGLPLVITSNLGFEPWSPGGLCLADLVGRAGVSRLMEMTGGSAYLIEGEDRR